MGRRVVEGCARTLHPGGGLFGVLRREREREGGREGRRAGNLFFFRFREGDREGGRMGRLVT